MAGMWLLDPHIDSGHRAKVLEVNPRKLKPLVTRTPRENWRIHPEWVQRYLLCRHVFIVHTRVFILHTEKTKGLCSFQYAG